MRTILILLILIGYSNLHAFNQVIKVGSEPDYPPFCMVNDNGEAEGFSVDLFKAAANVMGLAVEFKVGPWHIIKQELAEGKINALPLVGRSPEREKVYDFTFPYHTLHGVIFVRKGEKGIQNLEDLRTKSVLVMKGDNSEEYVIRTKIAGKVITTETYTEAFRFLNSGRYDAVIVQKLLGLQLLDALHYDRITALDIDLPGFAQDFSFAVREGDKELLSRLNEGLAIVIANGTYDKLYKQWFSPQMRPGLSRKEIVSIVLSITIPLALLLFAIAVIYLRVEIRRKTLHLTQEINERKAAELERGRLITAIEQSAEIIIITDIAGIIIYVNPSFADISGYERDEALGKSPAILKSGIQDRDFYKDLWKHLTQGKVWKGRIINRAKDSTLFTVQTTISPVLNDKGEIVNYLAVMRDITKELSMEQQMFQTQKMESIGRLAGGVAHDFNNMLSVILGYSELILSGMNPSDSIYNDIQEIYQAGIRSAELTAQLLAFSRKQNMTPRVMNVNSAIENMIKMIKRLIGENVYLDWVPRIDIPNVFIDPSQFDQIILNLCVNARDAVNDGGRITISTALETIDNISGLSEHNSMEPGDYCVITVRDNGSGMDPDTLSHIFEPFFSTKSQTQGTGLGLATIYGIVKQNHGYIHVSSEINQGSEFQIFLPVYDETGEAEIKNETSGFPQGQGELIVLVEDEPAILKMAEIMISSLGYEVWATRSASDVIESFEKNKRKVDLLLTDIVMPEMNGKELGEKIRAINPAVKILFMSGYTSNIIGEHGLIEESINFISKPFTKNEIAHKIYEVLHSGIQVH